MMTGYEQSGLTRREYCRQRNIPLTTFDYYRHGRKKKGRRPALVAVKIDTRTPPAASAMAVILSNGRRVEVAGGFAEADLVRLLRVAERA